MVSVVSYWLSRCSSKMSTSTLALAGTSMIPLICSRARARARRSPRPHTVWSSRIAAMRSDDSTWQLGLAKATISSSSSSAGIFLPSSWGRSCRGPHSPRILVGRRAGLPRGPRNDNQEVLRCWVLGSLTVTRRPPGLCVSLQPTLPESPTPSLSGAPKMAPPASSRLPTSSRPLRSALPFRAIKGGIREEVEEEEPPGRIKEAGSIHLEADQRGNIAKGLAGRCAIPPLRSIGRGFRKPEHRLV